MAQQPQKQFRQQPNNTTTPPAGNVGAEEKVEETTSEGTDDQGLENTTSQANMTGEQPEQKESAPVLMPQGEAALTATVAQEQPALSPVAQMGLRGLAKYIEDMAPLRPQNAESIARNQRALFRALELIVEKVEPAEFESAWERVLLAAGQADDGAFRDTLLFRGAADVQLSASERTAFFGLLNLIKGTSDSRTARAFLKQNFSISLALQSHFSDGAIARLEEFYNL